MRGHVHYVSTPRLSYLTLAIWVYTRPQVFPLKHEQPRHLKVIVKRYDEKN